MMASRSYMPLRSFQDVVDKNEFETSDKSQEQKKAESKISTEAEAEAKSDGR